MTGGIESQHAVIADAIKSTLVEACTAEYTTSILDFCFHSCTELYAYLDLLESNHDGIVEDTKHILDYSRTSGVISNLLQTYNICMISGVGRVEAPDWYDELTHTGISGAEFNATSRHVLRWMLYRPTAQRLENVVGDDGRDQYEIGMKNLQQVKLPYDVRIAMVQQLDAIFSLILERIQAHPWNCNMAIPLIVPPISSSASCGSIYTVNIQSDNAIIDWYMSHMCEVYINRINAVEDLPFPIFTEYNKRFCAIRTIV